MRIVHLFIVLLLVFSLPGCGHDSTSTTSGSSESTELVYLQLPETEAEVGFIAEDAIARCDAAIQEILNQDEPDFSNTIHAFNDAVYSDLMRTIDRLGTTANLAVSAEVRTAAYAAYNDLSLYMSQLFMENDLYLKVTEALSNSSALNVEQNALASKVVSSFEDNGLYLSEDDQDLLVSLKDHLGDLIAQFRDNMSEDVELNFSPEELQGVPESELVKLDTDAEGNYIDVPSGVVLAYANSEESRRKAYFGGFSVAKDVNPEVFAEIVQTRAHIAEIFGFETYSAYQTSSLMAGSPQVVTGFLEDLDDKLGAKRDSEIGILLDLKRTDTGNLEATLEEWDIPYYSDIYAKETFGLDMQSMKKYFELERTLSGMFSVFERVLDIEIIKRDTSDMQLWAEDVSLYEVRDALDSQPLGLLYFDPFPRVGKYDYYAAWFSGGNRSVSNHVTLPLSVVMGIWERPDPDSGTPSLLSFWGMRTLFHEFGHAIDNLMINTGYAGLNEHRRDFIEVASQLFERYCYDQEVLDSFAVSYLDETDTLPSDFAEKVSQNEAMFSGIDTGYQISFAMTDINIYSMTSAEAATLDVDAVYREAAEKYTLPFPEDASRMASFRHLVEGYDSMYYGYQWSTAIAADIKSIFESAGGLLDPDTGLWLREEIFAPGISRNENESLFLFLGRDWSVDAYAEELTAGY